jgi:hypothetical protein
MFKKLFISNEEFGKIIPDLKIEGKDAPYPVVNDRAVRATSGLMLMIGLIAFFQAYYTQNFDLLRIVVITFFLDFLLKTFKGPEKSIYGYFGKKFVSNQKPEFVGAIQKRFAWSLGLFVSIIIMLLLFIFNLETNLTLAVCAMYLSLMWLESAMGICVGCYIYNKLIKLGLVKRPKFHPACPGGVCETDNVEMIEMY